MLNVLALVLCNKIGDINQLTGLMHKSYLWPVVVSLREGKNMSPTLPLQQANLFTLLELK